MIERWEWEGGAVMIDATGVEAETSRQQRSAVELDDLEPPPPGGRVRLDDAADPSAEERRTDR